MADKSSAAAVGGKKRPFENDKNEVLAKIPKPSGHWALGLLSALKDESLHILSDDKMVVIRDKYPKARHHFLILPRRSIPNLKSLKKEDLHLLKHLDKVGHELTVKYGDKAKFRLGYHAVPSMSHLHMHVISQDFDSPSFKTKKHWNSFTTAYFVDSKDIMQQLEDTGHVTMDTSSSNDLLKSPLRCHMCSQMPKTIPALKTHLKTHNL